MAASPIYKIYSNDGEYLGSLKYSIDCASLITHMPDGYSIRLGHRKSDVVYLKGVTDDPMDSMDTTREIIERNANIRLQIIANALWKRQ